LAGNNTFDLPARDQDGGSGDALDDLGGEEEGLRLDGSKAPAPLQLQLPALGGKGRGRGAGAATLATATSGAGAAAGPTSIEALKASVAQALEGISTLIDTEYTNQVGRAAKAGEERIRSLAASHYEQVNNNLTASRDAMQQARDHHMSVKAHIKSIRDEGAALAADNREIQGALAALQADVDNRLAGIRKKFKL
ncbi:hypothetical protein HaLaN_21177, partial [Haematococcus lacustris]